MTQAVVVFGPEHNGTAGCGLVFCLGWTSNLVYALPVGVLVLHTVVGWGAIEVHHVSVQAVFVSVYSFWFRYPTRSAGPEPIAIEIP
jgi:hypothetical protein